MLAIRKIRTNVSRQQFHFLLTKTAKIAWAIIVIPVTKHKGSVQRARVRVNLASSCDAMAAGWRRHEQRCRRHPGRVMKTAPF